MTVTVAPTLTQTHTVMLTLTLAPTRLPPAAYPDSNPDTSPNPYLTWLLTATRRASHRRGACRVLEGVARAGREERREQQCSAVSNKICENKAANSRGVKCDEFCVD